MGTIEEQHENYWIVYDLLRASGCVNQIERMALYLIGMISPLSRLF